MNGIRIIICAKQVPDPEAPFAAVKFDLEAKKIILVGLHPVISPFDENALEAALRIKEEKGAEIIVLSLGEKVSPTVLRKVLAVGADRLVLLKDQRFQDLESSSVAYVLSKAIKKIRAFDLIMTGRQAGDWDLGQTGLILGEMLGIPTINLARNVRIEEGKVVVEKIMPGGYELVRARMPSLVTVSNEVGELRFASLKNTLMSKRQPIDVWGAEDLEIDQERLQKMALAALSPPQDMRRPCHFIKGDTPEEIGENLAMILRKEIF